MPRSSARIFIGGTVAGTLAIALAACSGGGNSAASRPLALQSTSFTTNENVALRATLTATGAASGAPTFKDAGSPAHGTLSSFAASGAFVYQPNPNFTGADSFAVSLTDSAGRTASGSVAITVTVNKPPTAAGYALSADGAALTSIDVLGHADDPDADPLTVSIQTQPTAGTAAVNSNGSVSITSLPSGFKGLVRFQYRVTDPSGASAIANAAVFVGANPFRAAFVGDASGAGMPEVYLTDFVSKLSPLTAATEGTLRLRGFTASANGSTVVYRRGDLLTATITDLSFVQSAAPAVQVRIAFPGAATPVLDDQGRDQYQVSPDGNWIAAVASSGGIDSVYLLNVAIPATVSSVSPAGTKYANRLRFSENSQSLYFLASPAATATSRTLYTVQVGTPGITTQVSRSPTAHSSDDVIDYSVAPDQSRILLEANRGGLVGLYFVDPRQLQSEIQVSQTLGVGESFVSSSMDLPAGQGGAARGERVVYTIEDPLTSWNTFVAEVSTAPDPRAVASGGALALGLRPDDDALLYTRGGQVYEYTIDSGTAAQAVGIGGSGWYDSTGNIVLLEQSLPSGGSPAFYPALAVAARGSFGTTQMLGTPNMAAQYFNVSGFDRAVVILGQGATTGPAPASAPLALFDALAPQTPIYLSDADQSGSPAFSTPLQLTSDIAQVVTD